MIVPLYPPLDGNAAERFPAFARALRLCSETRDGAGISALVAAEIEWISTNRHLGEQRLLYQACVRVLADLVRLRWRIVEQGFGIALENPKETMRARTREEMRDVKASLRRELEPVVNAQLCHPATRDFVRRMEDPGPKSGKRSVRLLIADGAELASRLAPALGATGDERERRLASAVRPVLELAVDEVIDDVTGHSLREIWRYFRYTWSIPQVPVPGRQLLYVLRDAGHPHRPIMGIAALNNCPLEMGEAREVFVGWHRRAVERRFQSAAAQGRAALECEVAWLDERLSASLDEIDATNLVHRSELENPTPELVGRLLKRGQEFARAREALLREIASNRHGDASAFDATSWEEVDAPPVSDAVLGLEPKASIDPRMHAARKRLIAKKRAHAMGRMLQARITLREHRSGLLDPARCLDTLVRPEVATAVNAVLDGLKARRAAANMLELTTCGAVRPYSRLLGGKLMALMMLSPEVGASYRRQYGLPSIISSQVKNEPVLRNSSLVFIGTTSLYVHGSSQYNRLKLPEKVISPGQDEISFVRVGMTSGFGTVQFSSETSKAIDELMNSRLAFKEVNGVFGEGTSPKLRKLKAGLRVMGFAPDKILQHRQRRLIYACPLFPTANEWLTERTIDLPDHVAEPQDFVDAGERIAAFWRSRWLARRLDHAPTIEALPLDAAWTVGDLSSGTMGL